MILALVINIVSMTPPKTETAAAHEAQLKSNTCAILFITNNSQSAPEASAGLRKQRQAMSATAPCETARTTIGASAGLAESRESAVPTRMHETAIWSDRLVDSIGINTHLAFHQSSYWHSYRELKTLLVDSGIRHLRDGPIDVENPACACNPLSDLGQAGIKDDIILSYRDKSAIATLKRIVALVPSVEAVEGPNEVNVNGDRNWVDNTRDFVADLYSAVKQLGLSIIIVGPSIAWIKGNENTYALIGDLTSEIQAGNIHDYPDGRNPGTVGFGPSFRVESDSKSARVRYGSIAASKYVDSAMAGSLPTWATETGYGDAPKHTPRTINARYEPRLFLEAWLAGVARTYQYQFIDYGSDGFGDFGIVTSSMHPKSTYYALKAFIRLLSDPGGAVSPSTVDYVINGASSAVHHLLMQKRDKSLYLAVWIEAEGYNVTTSTEESVDPEHLLLHFKDSVRDISLVRFNDDGTLTTHSLDARQDFAITATDHLQIIKLKLK